MLFNYYAYFFFFNTYGTANAESYNNSSIIICPLLVTDVRRLQRIQRGEGQTAVHHERSIMIIIVIILQPRAPETFEPIHSSGISFLTELGRI